MGKSVLLPLRRSFLPLLLRSAPALRCLKLSVILPLMLSEVLLCCLLWLVSELGQSRGRGGK